MISPRSYENQLNQKLNDLYELSMDRNCGQSVTSELTKVLSADKDKVHRDETQETTTMIPC